MTMAKEKADMTKEIQDVRIHRNYSEEQPATPQVELPEPTYAGWTDQD